MAAVRSNTISTSAVAEHYCLTDHKIDWNKVPRYLPQRPTAMNAATYRVMLHKIITENYEQRFWFPFPLYNCLLNNKINHDRQLQPLCLLVHE